MRTPTISTGSTDTQMFGCTEAEMHSMIEHNSYAHLLGKDAGDLLLAMSILSDAQELLAHGGTDRVRQYMNRSKFILSECMDRLDNHSKRR